jgi:CHAD domain-containing protein
MPARLPSDLLERSAQESSRLLALHHLEAIDAARSRLGDPLDQEALHDFRVGIRRLRSEIKAYRKELAGSVGGKMRRRLRQLARATNDGRDLEVQLDWLKQQTAQLAQDELPGFFWLVGRLEDRKQRTHDRAVADVARRYSRVADKLRKALGVLRIELQTGQGQRVATFREVSGALAQQQVAALRDELGRIQGPSDAGQAHRTRIALKRLRYLLEPIARRNRRAGALVRRFKEAQDLLGVHHDMHVLSSAVASLRSGGTNSSFSGLDAGLGAVARRADDAATSAFERFQSIWGGEMGGSRDPRVTSREPRVTNRILDRADELGRMLETLPAAGTQVSSLESRIAVPDELPTRDLQLETSDPQIESGNQAAFVTRDS